MFRVSSAAPDRGPLRPIPRYVTDRADCGRWSRFDVGERPDEGLSGLTIYGASRRDTAYAEVLAWKAATSETFAGLVEEAKFTGTSIVELLKYMYDRGIEIGGVDLEWRESRYIYTLVTETAVWVDIFHRDSVTALRGLVGSEVGEELLTVSTLTGDDRSLTTHFAETIRRMELKDSYGTIRRADGIRYPSKFGMVADDDYCWALWISGPEQGASITNLESVDPSDPDVISAMKITGVYVP